MKTYSAPTLNFSKFADDESIVASVPENTTPTGDTPEDNLTPGVIKPSPENPFT